MFRFPKSPTASSVISSSRSRWVVVRALTASPPNPALRRAQLPSQPGLAQCAPTTGRARRDRNRSAASRPRRTRVRIEPSIPPAARARHSRCRQQRRAPSTCECGKEHEQGDRARGLIRESHVEREHLWPHRPRREQGAAVARPVISAGWPDTRANPLATFAEELKS